MKNLFKSIMFVAAAAMTFTSCTKDEESVITPESKKITLSFSSERPELEGTRTEHNGTTVVWSTGDRIKLAYTLNGEYMGANAGEAPKFYTSADADITPVDDTHNRARFNVHGNFKDDSEGEYRFFALYPSDAYDSSNTTINDAPSVPVKVVDVQAPKAASFDHNADLMIGQSTEAYSGIPDDRMVSLLWKRLVAHAQITFKDIAAVDGETVNFVTFTAEEGQELTGTYNLDIETGAFEAKTASNSVKLVGEGLAIDNGQLMAWFCSLPFTTSHFTVVIDTNKATYTREVEPGRELNFEQNRRNKLTINMADAIKVEKGAETQLIPDGDYVIAIEKTYNQMMIVGTPTTNYRGVRALSTETIDGKLVVDDDAIWTITYEADKGGYKIMSYSEETYISAATSGDAKLGNTPLILDIQRVDGGYEISTLNATTTLKLGYNNSANPKRFAFYAGTVEHTLQIIPAFVDTTPTISVDPAELSFPAAGGSKTITVTAKYFGEYTVSATSSNQHFTTAKEGNVVTVTAPANETSAAITGTITITVTDGTNTKTATVAVEQAVNNGGSSSASLSKEEITNQFKKHAYGDAEESYVDAEDNVTWTFRGSKDAANRPWLQIKNNNNAYIKIEANANIRSVTLTISNATNVSGGITDITKHGKFTGTINLTTDSTTGTKVGQGNDSDSDNIITIDVTGDCTALYIGTSAAARIWGIDITTN